MVSAWVMLVALSSSKRRATTWHCAWSVDGWLGPTFAFNDWVISIYLAFAWLRSPAVRRQLARLRDVSR